MKTFDDRLKTVETNILAILSRLGPFFVALIPAIFTGYAVAASFEGPAWLGNIFATITALGIEVTGIKVIHTCVIMYESGHRGRGFIMALASLVYGVTVGAIVIYAHDAFTPLAAALGAGSPVLAMLAYLAVGLHRHLEDKTRSSSEALTKAQQQQQDKETQAAMMSHQLELAKIAARKEVNIAKHASRGAVSLGVSPETGNETHETHETGNETASKFDQAISRLLEDPNQTQTSLARELGVHRSTVTRAHKHLKETGQIAMNGSGYKVA
jgi:biotin operon repressor